MSIKDAASGVVEHEVGNPDYFAVAWSPSGTKVATGAVDGWLRIVDAASGVVGQQVDHGSAVFSVAWSP